MFAHLDRDTLLIPKYGYDPGKVEAGRPTGIPPRIFKNMLEAFQAHGFFPPEATFQLNRRKRSWEVILPANSCTQNMIKLAAFLYRDMECQHPETLLLAYRQWLALKEQGVTLWQCFHWAYAREAHGAGHGIYHFNGPFRWTPLLSLAFAQFCQTPKEEQKQPPYNAYYLTSAIDGLVQKMLGADKKTIDVQEEQLLNPEVGEMIQNSKDVKIENFREVIENLPGAKKVSKGTIRDYYW
jgi:hypothetical protein